MKLNANKIDSILAYCDQNQLDLFQQRIQVRLEEFNPNPEKLEKIESQINSISVLLKACESGDHKSATLLYRQLSMVENQPLSFKYAKRIKTLKKAITSKLGFWSILKYWVCNRIPRFSFFTFWK